VSSTPVSKNASRKFINKGDDLGGKKKRRRRTTKRGKVLQKRIKKAGINPVGYPGNMGERERSGEKHDRTNDVAWDRQDGYVNQVREHSRKSRSPGFNKKGREGEFAQAKDAKRGPDSRQKKTE